MEMNPNEIEKSVERDPRIDSSAVENAAQLLGAVNVTRKHPALSAVFALGLEAAALFSQAHALDQPNTNKDEITASADLEDSGEEDENQDDEVFASGERLELEEKNDFLAYNLELNPENLGEFNVMEQEFEQSAVIYENEEGAISEV